MSVVFKRGDELGRQDLNVFLKDSNDKPVNAAEISYNIYDMTSGMEVLLPPDDRSPVNPAVGEYYASFVIPNDANIGDYRIRWKVKQYLNSKTVNIVQDFAVVSQPTEVIALPGASAIEMDLLRGLRIMLRDNKPDRNYHFIPPAGESTVNEFNRVFGFIWEDEELIEFMRIALDSINMYAPQTFYNSLDSLMQGHSNWRSVLYMGAMIYALNALSINWIHDEFSYSIGGVSLDIDKSSKYMGMADSIYSKFNEMVESAKSTVLITKGLKQQKFGIGIRSSFGPSVGRGALTPKRFMGV